MDCTFVGDFTREEKRRLQVALNGLRAVSRPSWFSAARWTVLRERIDGRDVVMAVDNAYPTTHYGYSIDELVHRIDKARLNKARRHLERNKLTARRRAVHVMG